MSKREHGPILPEPYEELLTKWPPLERDEAFWEGSVVKVARRLDAAKAEAEGHEGLFASPLPPEAGEGSLPAASQPPRSLAELARMSLEADQREASAAEIAKQSLELGRQGRASAPILAEATRAAEARLAAERVQAQAEPPAPRPAAVVPLRKKSSAGPAIMAGIGLLGLAAAALIIVRSQERIRAPIAAQPPAALAPAATTTSKPSTPATDDDIVPLEELAQGKAGAPATAAPHASGDRVAAKGSEAKSAETKPQTSEPAKPEPKDDFDEKKKPAAIVGDIPEKPSTGAVQAAIGSVMGGARACVAGQQEASSATVTFGSDGRVQSVSVSGPAAGTPAEACIKAALSKALVQPFARPTFSVAAKVRPRGRRRQSRR